MCATNTVLRRLFFQAVLTCFRFKSFKTILRAMRYVMIANHRLALVVAANPTGEFPNNLQALSSTSPGIKDVKVCQNTFSGD